MEAQVQKKVNASDEEKNAIIKKYLELQKQAKENRQEIASLQKELLAIMESENVDRLFGDGKIVSKTHRQTFSYNEEKLREILEKKTSGKRLLRLIKSNLIKF